MSAAGKYAKRPRYVAIAAVPDSVGNGRRFVKYRFHSVEKFLAWVQQKWNPFFVNIYHNDGQQRGTIAYTWGRLKGLEGRR